MPSRGATSDLPVCLPAARPHPPAEKLRKLFDSPPISPSLTAVNTSSHSLLLTGAYQLTHSGHLPLKGAHAQRGQAAADSRALQPPPPSPAAPLLQRYGRLLVLEEAAMEKDICRWIGAGRWAPGAEGHLQSTCPQSPAVPPPPHPSLTHPSRFDQFNIRLRLAVFEGSTTRYRLLSLAPGPGSSGSTTAEGQRLGVYRGPALQLLQPGGVASQAAGAALSGCRALGGCIDGDIQPVSFP